MAVVLAIRAALVSFSLAINRLDIGHCFAATEAAREMIGRAGPRGTLVMKMLNQTDRLSSGAPWGAPVRHQLLVQHGEPRAL